MYTYFTNILVVLEHAIMISSEVVVVLFSCMIFVNICVWIIRTYDTRCSLKQMFRIEIQKNYAINLDST